MPRRRCVAAAILLTMTAPAVRSACAMDGFFEGPGCTLELYSIPGGSLGVLTVGESACLLRLTDDVGSHWGADGATATGQFFHMGSAFEVRVSVTSQEAMLWSDGAERRLTRRNVTAAPANPLLSRQSWAIPGMDASILPVIDRSVLNPIPQAPHSSAAPQVAPREASGLPAVRPEFTLVVAHPDGLALRCPPDWVLDQTAGLVSFRPAGLYIPGISEGYVINVLPWAGGILSDPAVANLLVQSLTGQLGDSARNLSTEAFFAGAQPGITLGYSVKIASGIEIGVDLHAIAIGDRLAIVLGSGERNLLRSRRSAIREVLATLERQ